jgi:rubrerythrin
MENRAVVGEILRLMREIELAVADLYRRFAAAFPQDRALWEDLSRDEDGHAETVSALRGLIGRSELPAAAGRVNLATIGTYLKGLEDHAGRLRRGEINRRSALFIALDLEKTLIERAFYATIKCDDPAYRALQDRIERETGSHLRKLEDHIAKRAAELG